MEIKELYTTRIEFLPANQRYLISKCQFMREGIFLMSTDIQLQWYTLYKILPIFFSMEVVSSLAVQLLWYNWDIVCGWCTPLPPVGRYLQVTRGPSLRWECLTKPPPYQTSLAPCNTLLQGRAQEYAVASAAAVLAANGSSTLIHNSIWTCNLQMYSKLILPK